MYFVVHTSYKNNYFFLWLCAFSVFFVKKLLIKARNHKYEKLASFPASSSMSSLIF